MSKHTPGPWTFYEEEDAPWTSIWIDSPVVDGESVCLAKLEEYSSVTMRANAALIAAAPEMLAELRTLLHVHRRKVHNKLSRGHKEAADLAQSHVDRISALIARATGES